MEQAVKTTLTTLAILAALTFAGYSCADDAKDKKTEDPKPPTELELATQRLTTCTQTLSQVRAIFTKNAAESAEVAMKLDQMIAAGAK